MNTAKREALQVAGWKIGDAADFFEMNDIERQLLDARVAQALQSEQGEQPPGKPTDETQTPGHSP